MILKQSTSTAIAVLAGFGVGVVLYGAVTLLAWHSRRLDAWMAFPHQILGALIAVAPGMTAGFLSRRSGFITGGLAGVLTSIAGSAMIRYAERDEPSENFVIDGMAYALGSLISNGVSGLAGVWVAQRDKT